MPRVIRPAAHFDVSLQDMIPEALNPRLVSCCGRSLVAADYHQIESDSDDWAMHDIHPEIGDFCDFGVSLTLDDDTVAYVTWDGTLHQRDLLPAGHFLHIERCGFHGEQLSQSGPNRQRICCHRRASVLYAETA